MRVEIVVLYRPCPAYGMPVKKSDIQRVFVVNFVVNFVDKVDDNVDDEDAQFLFFITVRDG